MANLIKYVALASVRCGNNPHSLYEFATASIRTSDTYLLARLRASFRSSFLSLGCSKPLKGNKIRKTEKCFVESAPKERINLTHGVVRLRYRTVHFGRAMRTAINSI